MDMSFYGGKQGKNFRIAKIFENKAEMITDLQARWNSTIGINELVFINYGNPADKAIYRKTNESFEVGGQSFTAPKDMTRWETNRYIDTYYKISTKVTKPDGSIVYEPIADGKLFNTTIWEKCYRSDELAIEEKTDPVNGMDKYLISDDFGVGYYLVASLTGNVPIITADSEWIFTDQEPEASVNNPNDPEHPNIHFKLPKGINFLFGTALIKKADTSATITDEKFGTGDYYINSNNGNIYLCTVKTGNKCTFQYKATLARQLDRVDTSVLAPYKKSGNTWVQNSPTGDFTMTDEEWSLQFGIPKAPLLSVASKVNILGADNFSKMGATGAIVDENTYQLTFSLPKASTWYVGTSLPTITDSSNQKDGDFFLKVDTYDVYRVDSSAWTFVCNIKGAKGEDGERGDTGKAGRDGTSLTITDSFQYTYDESIKGYYKDSDRTYRGNLTPSTAIGVSDFQNVVMDLLGTTPTPGEVVYMKYIKNDTETGYWMFYPSSGVWTSVKVTTGGGGSGSLSGLLDEYDEDNSLDKAYTTHYLNTQLDNVVKTRSDKGGLIDFDIANLDRTREIDFYMSEETDNMFDTVFSNMQSQINAFKNSTISITQGGTGATTAKEARNNLDVYSIQEVNDMIDVVTDLGNEASEKATAATSSTLSFTIPLKSSGTGIWSTTSDNKVQAVFSIANTFKDSEAPMIVCKDKDHSDYNLIESINFDANKIIVVMSSENAKEISLFAFYPK